MQAAQTVLHQENIFRLVNARILAIGDVNGRTGTPFSCARPPRTAKDILTGVASVGWQIEIVGLGRWADIVLLPNVGQALKQVTAALCVVELVKGEMISLH